jgi:hypothetical protein
MAELGVNNILCVSGLRVLLYSTFLQRQTVSHTESSTSPSLACSP